MNTAIPTPQEAAAKAIRVLGGPAQAARLLNVNGHRHQTVQSWLKNRVPAEYCPLIERATAERGDTVRCEAIRPDVDWGYLREQAAPAEPSPAPAEGQG